MQQLLLANGPTVYKRAMLISHGKNSKNLLNLEILTLPAIITLVLNFATLDGTLANINGFYFSLLMDNFRSPLLYGVLPLPSGLCNKMISSARAVKRSLFRYNVWTSYLLP